MLPEQCRKKELDPGNLKDWKLKSTVGLAPFAVESNDIQARAALVVVSSATQDDDIKSNFGVELESKK